MYFAFNQIVKLPLIAALLVLFFSGCQRKAIATQLQEMIGQELDMSGVYPIRNGYYCEHVEMLSDTLPSIVTYLDSTMCASCAINHLNDLNYLFDGVGPENRPYNLLFIVTPSTGYESEVLLATRTYQGDESFFMDKDHVFLKNNPFIPSDRRFHSFLIDRYGKVKIVGDPRCGEKLRSLYYSEIHCK